MNVEFGYAAGVHHEWCVASPVDRTRMLCRRQRGYVPTPQPDVAEPLHDECARLLARRKAAVVQPGTGICPACWGDVPAVRGRAQAHNAWVMRPGGPVQSDRVCAGAGEKCDAG